MLIPKVIAIPILSYFLSIILKQFDCFTGLLLVFIQQRVVVVLKLVSDMTRSFLISLGFILGLAICDCASAAEIDSALDNTDIRVVGLVKSVQATFNYHYSNDEELKGYALSPAVLDNYIGRLEELLSVSTLEGDQKKNADLLDQLRGAIEGLVELSPQFSI